MDNKSDAVPIERASSMWGSVSMMDRGDAPAQVVIEKTLKAQSERRTEETKEQLVKITDRVEQAMAAFELDEKLMNDNKAAFFVPDLIELEKIIKDTILKRKYQQEVTIFIVGYETKNGQRLKLLSQINDFFSTYINSIDEEEITPKPAVENEMEEISTRVQEAMDTASSAAQRLNDIGTDLFNFVEKLHGGKAASKSKKKLEKALMQAKDDIMNLTEKLMGAQTEIEEKEDQMTKLYKQIDVKNLEVMKYKNNAETAKKNLGQVEDLKLQIQEKQEEIDKLHRSMADRDLSMLQMEQSRETTLVKLRAAGEDSEQTIDKLQSKVTTLQVQLEESRNDLQRHHESTIVSLKHQHNAQIDAVKAEYQEKIDKLEEELANKVKHWAPDSDDESEKQPSFSRRSSQLDLASRKSNRPELESKMSQTEGLEYVPRGLPSQPLSEIDPSLKDDKSVPPSRQSSNIHKKVDSLSRQSSITTPAQETPKPATRETPDTPKSQKSDSSKASKPNTPKVATDSTDSAAKVATPKKAGRNKSNLEPVHEVPFEEKIPIEDEGRWEKVSQEKLPSAFKQYRKEALFIVQGLQNEVKVVKEDSHKKVTVLRTQVKEKEEQWETEKHLLVQKVGIVEKQKMAAEKEADEAIAQLENFVKEQGQMAKITEEESKEKKLKKLTPEQRLKYFGPEKSNPSVDTKEPVTDNKEAAQNGKATGISSQEQLVTDGEEPNGEPPPAQAPPAEGTPPIEEVLPIIEATDHEMQTTPVVQVGRSQQTSRVETRGHQEIVDRLMATGRLKSRQRVTESQPSEIESDPDEEEKKLLTDTETQTDPWSPNPNPPSQHDSPPHRNPATTPEEGAVIRGARPLSRESDFDADVESDAFSERSLAMHLSRVLQDLTLSDEGEEDEGRPQSSTSQRSLYEKYRAQLEQKKAEIVERRSRATSMHGSLLSAKSEKLGSRPRSNLTTSSGDIPFPDEASKHRSSMSFYRGSVQFQSRAPSMSNESGVTSMHDDEEEGEETMVTVSMPASRAREFLDLDVDKMDMATSPVAFSVSSRSSKQSVESVADHPITQDYLKAYQIIMDFKDSLIKVLADKDLLAAADRLSDIGQLTFDRDLNVQNQVFQMTTNIHSFLKEAASIINSYLYNDLEPTVSSLITQGDASKAMSLGKENTAEKPTMERETTNTMTAETDPEIRDIRENYENMKSTLDQQKKDYEDKLNNNAVMMMELQDTIQELQHELSAFGSPTKPYSAMSGFSSRFDPKTEPTIIFSRMDSERNQKALKRAVNAQRLEPEYYNEVVQAMDQYTVLPAKRLVHLAKKYAHHTHMKQIEENVRQSNSLDEEVYTLLERMEALQSLRAQRWGEQMDVLSSERLHLAHMLMEALQRVEEESGIFMIKPILSWRGRNQVPLYQQSRVSGSYRPQKTFLKPIPPLRDGTPLNMVPAPTPASQHPIKSATTRPRTQEPPVETTSTPADQSNDIPVKGSSIQLVGPQSQPMWAMSSSFTRPGADGDAAKDRFAKITTPRILELDVNRMLIGQNTVSALTKPFLSNDRLVNASNASVRSYMSIDRPSANPAQTRGRPNSTGTEGARQSPSVLAVKTPNSAGSRHSRTRSEGALSLSQPLPPIKVPPNNDPDDGVGGQRSNEGSRPGTTGSVGSSIQRRDLSRPVTHPSPPRTPPGSSIRQSPPFLNILDQDEKQDDDDDAGSAGHVTKISMRSASQSTERSFTPDRET